MGSERARRPSRAARATDRFQREVAKTVRRFTALMTELARRAVVREAELGLAATGSHRRRASDALLTSGVLPGHSRPGRGSRRTAAELDELAARFVAFVAENPGLGIEQTNEHLGTTTADLALPIRKLVAADALKTEGRNRATRYFIPVAPPPELRTTTSLAAHPSASGMARSSSPRSSDRWRRWQHMRVQRAGRPSWLIQRWCASMIWSTGSPRSTCRR